MQRSSKVRRRELARRWKRALLAGLWAASFAAGSFVWGQESAATRRKLPTKSVMPAVQLRAGAKSTSPAPQLLGARGGAFRPVAIEAIPAGDAPAQAKEVAAQAKEELQAAAPIAPLKLEVSSPPGTIINPTVKARPLPIKNARRTAQPKEPSAQPQEQLAPIVSAASFRRAPKTPAPEPADDHESAAEPLSPWMQDIRSSRPAAENPVRLEAPEPSPASPAPPKISAQRTIFERAATPVQREGEISLQGNEVRLDDAPELAEQEPAPIVDSPSRGRLLLSQPRRESPPAAARPIQKPREVEVEIEEPAELEPLVMAVQNENPPAALPAPEAGAPEAGAPEAGAAVDQDADLKKHFEVIQQTGEFTVQVHRSKLLRTAKDIYRTAVVDDAVLEIVQFTPREISLIGRSQGATHVTFWFDDPATQPVTYLVKVEPDAGQVKIDEEKYQLLEDMINEMFPDSKIHLQLIANKLVVRGQARDSEEAFQIMSLIRVQGGFGGPPGAGPLGGGSGIAGIGEGPAADPLTDSATGAARRSNYQIINMLRVPGVQQVALRVKIAELNRTAARNFGMNVQGRVDISTATDGSKLLLNSILGNGGQTAPAILANFDGDDISVGLNTLQQHGVVKLLSEPTLVTLSGNPATFIAGGEFAVPTIVGSAGLNAVTTDFRAFGAIISFLPTVVDKDRIRLQVAPEFSQINSGLTVNGTPGLKVRAATTTVEMREGQTLAIAGLLEDNVNANTAGDIPFLAKWIGKRGVTRAETELIILVTPELVHPMEPEEVPPLPGFDVTEPTNGQFYFHGDIEGNPTLDYRSTVWPRLKKRYKAGGPAMTSGPFGHGQ
jgi:pilus assembly protein CpaC